MLRRSGNDATRACSGVVVALRRRAHERAARRAELVRNDGSLPLGCQEAESGGSAEGPDSGFGTLCPCGVSLFRRSRRSRAVSSRRLPTVTGASRSRSILALVLALIAGLPRSARADTPSLDQQLESAVSVVYDLPSSCPSVGDFERDVAQRAPRARFTLDAAARQFHVAAWPDAREWVGEVTAVPAVDASSVRRVRGATCADVVAALALIVALALDPEALREASHGDAVQNPAAAPAPVAPQPASAAPAIVPPPPVYLPPPPPVPEMESSAGSQHASRWRMSLGGGALVALGVAPGPLFGASISADVTPSRDRVLTWLFRLSASALFPRELGEPLKARFGAQLLTLEGCPFRLPLGSVISLLPCLGIEGGVVEVRGVAQPGLVTTQNQSALFLGAVQPLRVQVRLGSVFSLEVDGTLKEPFHHDSFGYSRPSVTVHTVPPVTGSFGLGLRAALDFL